jgi:hypothetical protein
MKMFKLKIKSGEQAGRCVGMRFGGGLVTYPDVQMNPPVSQLEPIPYLLG